MRVELGCPIVIERRGDRLQLTRIHLPVPQLLSPFGTKTIEQATYMCTLAWTSQCGLEGWLYAYGGPLRSRRLRFCTVCVAEANRLASAASEPTLVDALVARVGERVAS